MFKKKQAGEKPPKQEEQKSIIRDYFESLVVAVILAMIIKTFVLQTFQIPTGSMEDGLLVGDQIIVNKMIYGENDPISSLFLPVRDIERGDVVIFKFPPDPKTDYIKRVIGLPGETVRIYRHQVWINGKPIEELGLDEDSYTLQWREADKERAQAIGADDSYTPESDYSANEDLVFAVPEGHYFMMGDHRAVSLDSRYWLEPGDDEMLRYVPRENIIGRAEIIYWSSNVKRGAHLEQKNYAQQLGDFLWGIVKFPFDTRWNRMFTIVK